MLELAKGREVTIEQAQPWGPISVTQRDGASETGAVDE
jgi:hypothetical protein